MPADPPNPTGQVGSLLGVSLGALCDLQEEALLNAFGPFGQVLNIKLLRDKGGERRPRLLLPGGL